MDCSSCSPCGPCPQPKLRLLHTEPGSGAATATEAGAAPRADEMRRTHLGGQAAVAVHVAEVHLATWRQHAVHLPQHPRLVGGQVDLRSSGGRAQCIGGCQGKGGI